MIYFQNIRMNYYKLLENLKLKTMEKEYLFIKNTNLNFT